MHKRWIYFTEDEMRCKGSGNVHMDEDFMTKLVSIRKKLSAPMTITSAYRDPEHNDRVGGSKSSAHVEGKAVDIACYGEKAFKIVELALAEGFSGIGVSQKGPHGARFIHLDTMEINPLAARPWIWSY